MSERYEDMTEDSKYYVVKQKALPEVLLKVAQVNKIIETKRMSIAEATEAVVISRRSYINIKTIFFLLEIM